MTKSWSELGSQAVNDLTPDYSAESFRESAAAGAAAAKRMGDDIAGVPGSLAEAADDPVGTVKESIDEVLSGMAEPADGPDADHDRKPPTGGPR